jgi:hypothetical protein
MKDELKTKLETWQVSPRIPQNFPREVWQRIAARQTEREEALWPRLREWLSGNLVRPQYAGALVAISISASIGVAHLQALDVKAKDWKRLETRYAASIDPLKMSH